MNYHFLKSHLSRQLLLVSIFSFVLQFMWELAQCIPFFVHLAEAPTIRGMVRAALGDVLLTLLAFGVTWILSKDKNWILKPWSWKIWVGLIGSAVVLSMSVELFALKMKHWKYTEINPTLPYLDVSIVPIAQLIILFPLSFWLTKKTLLKINN